jgi:antitoxin (DNA-binding transcriptional repressor) of toxin-antitoxin stability system
MLLRRVKLGETIAVTNRDRPVALLAQIPDAGGGSVFAPPVK